MTTLSEFYHALENHDWFYAMADDGASFDAGLRERNRINAIACESALHRRLLDDFHAHVYRSRPKPLAPAIPDLTEGTPT